MTDKKVNGLLGAGEPISSPEIESLQSGMKKVPSTSRFQVARVDFCDDVDKRESENGPVEEKPEIDPKDVGIQRQESVASHRDSIHVYIDTTSPNATYHNNTHKTFGKYTTEALPHVDHYRNLLSATNALKSRPTLAELHEEKVRNTYRTECTKYSKYIIHCILYLILFTDSFACLNRIKCSEISPLHDYILVLVCTCILYVHSNAH